MPDSLTREFLDAPWNGTTFDPPTPQDIATAERNIVDQLDTYLGQVLGTGMIEVGHFPDRPQAYELRHRIGSVLVTYAGSTYDKIDDIGHVVQQREMLWDIAVLVRDLGWAYGGPGSGTSPGAYQIIEFVRKGVLGFQPNTGFTPMRAIHDRFLNRDNQGGVWMYELRFATRTKVVEQYQLPEAPLFTHGTALEQGGITAIQVQFGLFTFSAEDLIVLGQRGVQAVIVKSQNLSTTYVINSDYELNDSEGVIARDTGGNIPAGATVAISYAYADIVDALAGRPLIPFAPSN